MSESSAERDLDVALELQALGAIFGGDAIPADPAGNARPHRPHEVFPASIWEALQELGGMHPGDAGQVGMAAPEADIPAPDGARGVDAAVHVVVQLLPVPGGNGSENFVGIRLHFSLPQGYPHDAKQIPRLEVAPQPKRLEQSASGTEQTTDSVLDEQLNFVTGTFGLDEQTKRRMLDAGRESLKSDSENQVPGVYNACAVIKELLDQNNISPAARKAALIEAEDKERLDRRLRGTEVTAEAFSSWAERYYAEHPEQDPLLDDDRVEAGLSGRQMFVQGAVQALAAEEDEYDEGADDSTTAPAAPAKVDWELFDETALDDLPEEEEED